MKSKFVYTIRTLVAMLVFCTALYAQSAAPQTMAKPAGQRGAMRGNERHPAIRQAIKALERAKDEMQRANHDFGGHRESALKACDDAIAQLKQALAYDKK